MAEKKGFDNWLWIGVIVVGVAAIIFLVAKQFGFGFGFEGEGDYYANESIDEFVEICWSVCAALAVDPNMVEPWRNAYTRHMVDNHTDDIQEGLNYAENYGATGDEMWKDLYDEKVKAVCRHTLAAIRVPRRALAGPGGTGSTGNLIPFEVTRSDVYIDLGPSPPGETVLPV